ncbi:hypothetical protein QSJ18_16130, partial [Gordonia sp. ABSL1-1]|uniref:hypothetical protein n=1 Tax=Gordonia sp. ABSL1-1 TaxID=3053923 RepID=UPI0025744654
KAMQMTDSLNNAFRELCGDVPEEPSKPETELERFMREQFGEPEAPPAESNSAAKALSDALTETAARTTAEPTHVRELNDLEQAAVSSGRQAIVMPLNGSQVTDAVKRAGQ